MTKQIRGKVAKILNYREIVINVGRDQGVKEGMYFDILDRKGEEILDPDTGEIIGSVNRPKIQVQIKDVHEKIAVATTYKKKKVNIGGMGPSLVRLGSIGDSSLSSLLMPPKYIDKYETLKTDEKTWDDLDEDGSFVKTGDPVVQVLAEE